jgi:hypothetical protein
MWKKWNKPAQKNYAAHFEIITARDENEEEESEEEEVAAAMAAVRVE